ncbi:hypothetical protein IL992_31410 [Microbispora sp. NEAU-D428]|uniref:hypothetical protein n=1 Tax=Microbispora sitophila TaxID=2771537 RepID=UPI001868EE97|nr:hypothetical protein [Microbispora sitophila]MBE3013655.1 hypothetical protein [Microbispora sitophila]
MRFGVTGSTTLVGIFVLPSWSLSRMRAGSASKTVGRTKWCSISVPREALRGKSFPWPVPQLRSLPFADWRVESDDQCRPATVENVFETRIRDCLTRNLIFIGAALIRASPGRRTGLYQQDRISGTTHRRRPL